jgi:hypothetical protein
MIAQCYASDHATGLMQQLKGVTVALDPELSGSLRSLFVLFECSGSSDRPSDWLEPPSLSTLTSYTSHEQVVLLNRSLETNCHKGNYYRFPIRGDFK